MRYIYTTFLALLLLMISACNTTKNVYTGEYLITKVKIRDNTSRVNDEILYSHIKQRTNRKFLRNIPLFLRIYNLINVQKAEKKYKERQEKRKIVNLKRQAKGKKKYKENPGSLREWAIKAGEAPVIYSEIKREPAYIPDAEPTVCNKEAIEKSANQLRLLLNDKGYFRTTVKDSIVLFPKKKQAHIYFDIQLQPAYTIKNIAYDIPDPNIALLIINNYGKTNVKPSTIYDRDLLSKERDRITALLKDNGYYAFSKQFIAFEVDSNTSNKEVNVTLTIRPPISKDLIRNSIALQTFTYRNIYVHVQQSGTPTDTIPTDTILQTQKDSTKVYILYSEELKINANTLLQRLKISTKALYKENDIQQTYFLLNDLQQCRPNDIRIQFTEWIDTNTTQQELDVHITLHPRLKQSAGIEPQFTNTGGNFIVSTELEYINRNLLKNAEQLAFRIRASVEKRITAISSYTSPVFANNPLKFNTFYIGPQIVFTTPRFLFPRSSDLFIKNYNAKTQFQIGYVWEKIVNNYTVKTFSLGMSYKVTINPKLNLLFYPAEISYINATANPEFIQVLLAEPNENLRRNNIRKYTSRMIPDTRLVLNYSSGKIGKKKKTALFATYSIESAGSVLKFLQDKSILPPNWRTVGEDTFHVLFKVPYSQYVRTEVEIKYYRDINRYQTLILRTNFGIAKAFGNAKVVPIEKSFFTGGQNSLRAWNTRLLGLGSATNPNRIDQTGDIKWEQNIELRTKLIGPIETAIFADMGNVWLLKSDVPEVSFSGKSLKTLLKECGVATGVGLRLNFTFFIIRMDGAIRLQDPALPLGSRIYSFKGKNALDFLGDIKWNVAINMPF